MDITFTNAPKQEHVTLIAFQNDGQFKKEDEGIPIMINEHPIGAITKINDKLVEGFIINRYMGLEYSEINGERCLSGICFGRPILNEEKLNERNMVLDE